jgi:hypothetical protein
VFHAQRPITAGPGGNRRGFAPDRR